MPYSSTDIRREMKLMILSNDWGNFRNYIEKLSTFQDIQYAISITIQNYKRLNESDWGNFRNFIEQLSTFEEIQYAIRYIIQNYEDERLEGFPTEFLKFLFEKRCDAMESAGIDVTPYSRVKAHRYVMLEIDQGVCCLPCRNGHGIVFSLPRPILDLILKEHAKLYGSNKIDYYGDCVRDVGYMWARKLAERTRTPYLPDVNIVTKAAETQLLSINSIDDLKKESNSDLYDLWERTIRIIMHLKSDNSPLLHYVVRKQFPVVFVWLVAKLYPNQICLRDDEGKIPLHNSFKSHDSVFTGRRFVIEFSDEFYARTGIERPPKEYYERKTQTYTKLLLQNFPEGATYGDDDGKLPLTTYLENAIFNCTVTRQHQSDVQLLIHAAPQAAKTRDTTSHLFPFMIPSQDGAVLTVSYDILRYDPSVLKFFTDPSQSLDSFYEKHLKRRILNLKKQNDADASTKQEDTLLSSSENETIMKQQEEIKRLRSLLHEKHGRDDGQDGSCLSDSDPNPKRKRI